MVTATVVEGFTRNDIRREVMIWTNRDLGEKQFYEWLPYCLVQRKPLYSKRDVAKFIFVASYLSRDRSLTRARDALINDIQQNPERYELC